MYLKDRDTIIKAVEHVRIRVCCYLSTHFCDCKYGIDQVDMSDLKNRRATMSEVTGCPELREVVGVLSAMTPSEYGRVLRRVERQRKQMLRKSEHLANPNPKALVTREDPDGTKA